MASLTVDMLLKSSRTVRQHRGEADDDYLARLTHVALEGKRLRNLVRARGCGATRMSLEWRVGCDIAGRHWRM